MKQKQLDKMWAQYDAVCKRLERLQNDDGVGSYSEWCELVRKESEMRRFLNSQVWGSYEPLNLPKTEEEKITDLQEKSSEDRHILLLCDFGRHFKSAKGCEKSGPQTWTFESEFNKLKTYKETHNWDNAFILTHFGVNFKHAKSLYYALRK